MFTNILNYCNLHPQCLPSLSLQNRLENITRMLHHLKMDKHYHSFLKDPNYHLYSTTKNIIVPQFKVFKSVKFSSQQVPFPKYQSNCQILKMAAGKKLLIYCPFLHLYKTYRINTTLVLGYFIVALSIVQTWKK